MDFELRDVEYFAVLAEHGHVGRAAEALGLGQPALSISLRRLEKAAGAKLVKRTPKGVELTAVGAALLSHVSRLRLARDDLARELGDLSRGRAGRLRIGSNPPYAEELPAAYASLLREAPSVTLAITVSDNDVMIPALRNGELDLVINYLADSPYEGCVTERLYDEEIVVCASARHPLAKQKVVTMAELTRERWALSPVNMLPWHWLHRAFSDRGLPPPKVTVETRSIRLRVQTVATSNLLGFISKRNLRQTGPGFHLKELPVKEVTWRRTVGVIYRKEGYLSPAARRLIEILKIAARETSHERTR